METAHYPIVKLNTLDSIVRSVWQLKQIVSGAIPDDLPDIIYNIFEQIHANEHFRYIFVDALTCFILQQFDNNRMNYMKYGYTNNKHRIGPAINKIKVTKKDTLIQEVKQLYSIVRI